MKESRTILIIGGGLLQVPIIQTAKTMQLKVVVADMNPDSIGFRIADDQIIMSTKDVEGMVREAKRYAKDKPIHGVITAGTDASMTVAAVANSLDLPGIRFVDAEACSNKVKMRKRLREHNVPIPNFAPVWNIQDARDALEYLKFPLVIKPADNMGARGVIKIENREEMQAAFKHAKKFCPTGELILEEYMTGAEVSVDALSYNNNYRMTGIADRIIEREPFFIEMGHNMPSNLSKQTLDEVERVMIAGMKALGINLGAGKGDIKITPDGVKVGEIAARLSGGFMSAFTYPLSTGVNLNRAAILIAMGEEPDNLDPVLNRVSIERSLLARPGKLLAIHGLDVAKRIDGVNEIFIQSQIGEIIKDPTNNIEKTGHVIITADHLIDAESIFKKVQETIRFEVDEVFGISEKEMNQNARMRFGREVCWVCKICDGSDCASSVPGMGGIGVMETFQDNSKSLSEYQILPKYIRENTIPTIQSHFLGYPLETPIMGAPMTGAVTNMNGAMTDEQYADIVLRGFVEAGSLAWLGDGATPDKYKLMINSLSKVNGKGILICKPREDEGLLRERMQEAERAGIVAIGMDIDAVNFKTMVLKNLNSISREIKVLEKIRSFTKLPFILKGIMDTSDAMLAVEGGFSAIVVSNHGGRVLDGLPGTARVLPKIVEKVKGKIAISVDGGIRSGMDAFKMLALGAETVLIGRPVAIAAVGADAAGVKFLIQKYSNELKQTLSLTACRNIADAKPDMLFRKFD
ncbi:alpha-hydroxy-acid oxidizing protein [Leptospira sp. GIMC2001]|uniref:alpha-hydroxy-acid oxidizing protein n=1 Tax=Leptospira sp. GIMC2001 TaxID=1513297 RepID=UPI0023496A35|nr:alpha-hydroxy-acid oxidizing protein [Leptospira sp. GIMC2001]WCL48285.1 alpha-hydroxy-acid oxidizing protein [Leptospira sp. GIMC2001]